MLKQSNPFPFFPITNPQKKTIKKPPTQTQQQQKKKNKIQKYFYVQKSFH